MKSISKLLLSLSITLILYTITTLKYSLICLGENTYGYGHYFVWLQKGYTSLSYKFDLYKLLFDFLFFLIPILLIVFLVKNSFSRWTKIAIYCISILIILIIAPYFLISEIYLEIINCKVIYSSFDSIWL